MKCVIKEQEASGLLSSLGLKTDLSKIPLIGDILFDRYKINRVEIGPFTETGPFQETRDWRYICKHELDKAFFQHDMTCGDFRDLSRKRNEIMPNQ